MARIRPWLIPAVFLASLAAMPAIGYGLGWGGEVILVAQDTPADEAVTSAGAWIKAHPKDGDGYRALGRVHALAWAYGNVIPLAGRAAPDSLPLFPTSSPVCVTRAGPGEMRFDGKAIVQAQERKERPITADDAKHLAASLVAYRQALDLNAKDAVSELGLGWMLAQQGVYVRDLPADYFPDPKATEAEKATWARAIGQLANDDAAVRDAASKTLVAAMPRCTTVLRDVKSDDPEAKARIDAILRGHFELQALDHYRKAFELQAPLDLKEQFLSTEAQLSGKAGGQILEVLTRHPEVANKGESKAVQDVLEELSKKVIFEWD